MDKLKLQTSRVPNFWEYHKCTLEMKICNKKKMALISALYKNTC